MIELNARRRGVAQRMEGSDRSQPIAAYIIPALRSHFNLCLIPIIGGLSHVKTHNQKEL